MSDATEAAYRELQQEYLDELPKIFAELRSGSSCRSRCRSRRESWTTS